MCRSMSATTEQFHITSGTQGHSALYESVGSIVEQEGSIDNMYSRTYGCTNGQVHP